MRRFFFGLCLTESAGTADTEQLAGHENDERAPDFLDLALLSAQGPADGYDEAPAPAEEHDAGAEEAEKSESESICIGVTLAEPDAELEAV